MATTTETKVLRIAAVSAGVCTRAELLAAGVSSATIADRVTSGFLVRVASGLYQVPALATPETPVYLAARAHPDGVVSHGTAAHLWGFAFRPATPADAIDVTIPRPGTARPRLAGIRIHSTRRWSGADLAEPRAGLAATGRARTIVDLAGAPLGDRRLRHITQTELVKGRVTVADIVCGLERLGGNGVAGSGRLRRLLAELGDGDPQPESELEHRLAPILGERFRRQYRPPWYDGVRGVVDAAEPRSRTIVEADGRRWHATEQAMAEDRRRDRLAATNGWLVLRVTWDDVVNHPDSTAADIAATIARRSDSPLPNQHQPI